MDMRAMYRKYTVDVTRPAAKMAELESIAEANKSSKTFNAVSFLSMIAVVAIAVLAGKMTFGVAAPAFFGVLGIFLYTGYVGDYRKGALKRLSQIEGAQCAEMVDFLSTAECPSVLRYVAEVRQMGRRFTQLEFSALRDFEDQTMAKAREAKAVEALYGVQAEKSL